MTTQLLYRGLSSQTALVIKFLLSVANGAADAAVAVGGVVP